MTDDLDRARALLQSAAHFDPKARPPVLALVRFKDRTRGGMEAIVHMRDERELRQLRKVLKNLNAKLTVTRLHSISVGLASIHAWRELGHLEPRDVRGLRQHPEVLDAIAELDLWEL